MSARTRLRVYRIMPDGSILAIYSDDRIEALRLIGETTVTRASHVEPLGDGWSADMSPVNGPVLGPFPSRQAALNAEVEWLTVNRL